MYPCFPRLVVASHFWGHVIVVCVCGVGVLVRVWSKESDVFVNLQFLLLFYSSTSTLWLIAFSTLSLNNTTSPSTKNGTQNKTQKTHKSTTNKCSSKMMMCTHFVNTTFQLPARHPCGTPCFHGWYIRSVRCLWRPRLLTNHNRNTWYFFVNYQVPGKSWRLIFSKFSFLLHVYTV